MTDDLLSDPRITAMGLFTEAYTGLTARMTGHFAEHGLDPVAFETLIRLSRSPGHLLRMSDLANQTGLSTSGVTRVVDRLERDGLVRRQACETDRRGSFTVITEAGLDRLRSVLPDQLALIERWFTGLLSPEQLTDMLAALRVVRDTVRPGATSGATSGSAASGTPAGC